MSAIQTGLDVLEPLCLARHAEMEAERRGAARCADARTYFLVHSAVDALKAMRAGRAEAARALLRRWRALADAMLHRQLFGDDPCTLAVPLGDPAAAVHGVDGATACLATMVRGQAALLRAAMREAGVEVDVAV